LAVSGLLVLLHNVYYEGRGVLKGNGSVNPLGRRKREGKPGFIIHPREKK